MNNRNDVDGHLFFLKAIYDSIVVTQDLFIWAVRKFGEVMTQFGERFKI